MLGRDFSFDFQFIAVFQCIAMHDHAKFLAKTQLADTFRENHKWKGLPACVAKAEPGDVIRAISWHGKTLSDFDTSCLV